MWENYYHRNEEYIALFVEETKFFNRIVLGTFLSQSTCDKIPHFVQTWMRNIISGFVVYLVTCLLWSYVIYYSKPNHYVPKDNVPSLKSVLLQIKVAAKAIPWYTLYLTINEHIVESGLTKCFPRFNDVGFFTYIINLIIYMMLVEFGMYWMHRELHDIKPFYKLLHATHHVYNKQNTLSPFAGLAFDPLDGILQGIPHAISLFIVPIQLRAHIALLFIEGLWTANIHDGVHIKMWPIMGASYHTIHHTTYKHNYGHITVFMDWAFGTLREPVLDIDETVKIK